MRNRCAVCWNDAGSFSNRATTLQAYTTNKARLREAVGSIEQTHRPTRIDDALLLADSLANQHRSTTAYDPAVQRIVTRIWTKVKSGK